MADDANYLAELDDSLPDPDGFAGEGDDEVRTIKRSILQTLPGDPDGTYNEETPDLYDTGVLVGPRFLNAVPARFAAVEARLTAIETGGGLDPFPVLGGMLPIGAVIMWTGAIADIPAKYKLCDGSNGTPDLRNRFIVGAADEGDGDYMVGESGGNLNQTISGGAHTHTLTIAGRMLAIDEIPNHGHRWQRMHQHASSFNNDAALGGIALSNDGTNDTVPVNDASPSAASGTQIGTQGITQVAHGHPGSTADSSATHDHVVLMEPRYYALCFIMYTG